MPVLYRAALSSLSVARATSLDHSLIDYLESLCHPRLLLRLRHARRPRQRLGAVLRATTGRRRCRALWRETLVVAGDHRRSARVVGYVLVMQRSRAGSAAFVPGGLVEGRDPTATTAFLRATLYDTAHGKACWRCWRPSCSPTTPRSPSSPSRSASPSACRPPSCWSRTACMLGAFFAALRLARAGLRAGRLALHPRRHRALRHHPGRRGRLPDRLARRLPGRAHPARRGGRGRPRGRAGDGRRGADAGRAPASWKASRAS